jgi:hypothetical protein
MATSTLGSGTLVLAGTTSGTTTVTATAVAGTTTLTLPAATDTLVGKATTDTLTNKTLTGAAMNGTLGATTPSTGAFTTVSATGLATLTGGASFGSNTTWASDNTFNIGAVGANRPANIYVGSAGAFGTSLTIGTTLSMGQGITFSADNTYNIGAIGATRPANIYIGSAGIFGTGIAVGGATPGAGGLAFPATAVAVANANTLDDYEEGTWTPTLVSTGGSAPAYTTQDGKYFKIGGIVYVFGTIIINGTLPAGNYTRIQGLPFSQSSTQSGVALKYSAATGVSSGQFITAAIGSAEISFARNDGNGEIGAVGLNASYISTTFSATFSTMYQAS